jgi:hypothetical protein
MRTILRAAALFLAAWAAMAIPAAAAVTYHFDFTQLSGPRADFALEFVVPDYITVTGLTPYLPQPTSLGYDVMNFGTSNIGSFGFSYTGGVLTDYSFTYSATSFFFAPDPYPGSYITAPGVFSGIVLGNAGTIFSGNGVLTVTASPAVPEPETWALLIAGFGVAGGAMRLRRSHATA